MAISIHDRGIRLIALAALRQARTDLMSGRECNRANCSPRHRCVADAADFLSSEGCVHLLDALGIEPEYLWMCLELEVSDEVVVLVGGVPPSAE